MHVKTYLLLGVLLFGAGTVAGAEALVLGRPASEVVKEYERLAPIAEYLGENLKELGVTSVDVRLDGKNSLDATVDMVRKEEIDIVFETPYGALEFIERVGMAPLLTIVRENAPSYHSVIFVRSDSGIENLAELKGKVVAFEDPGSTSSFRLPRRAFDKAGIALAPAAAANAAPGPETVGYVFAGSEVNVAGWVFFGKVSGGALSNLDWQDQAEVPERFRRQMTIIQKTRDVPRMVALVRSGLDPQVVDGVRSVFLAMPETREGRAALSNYKINSFEPIDDPAAFLSRLQDALGR